MELRRLAETVVRRSLLAVPGISQVVPIGGDVREYLVELDPAAVVQAGISVEEVVKALEAASAVPAAGFHVDGGPGVPRARPRAARARPRTSRAPCCGSEDGIPLRLGQIASVRAGARARAGHRVLPRAGPP